MLQVRRTSKPRLRYRNSEESVPKARASDLARMEALVVKVISNMFPNDVYFRLLQGISIYLGSMT